MNEHTPIAAAEDDEQRAAVDRVRAADPAASVEPDGAALRTAVDRRLAAGGTDQLAAARARRWTSWPARVAGVAAAALLLGGGGGYAVGAAGAGSAPPAAESITLGGGASGPAARGGEESAPEMATADAPSMAGPAPMGGAETKVGPVADQSYWGGYGRTTFTSSGLSEEGGTAQAWTFDPGQAFTEEVITRVAAALGVSGQPVLQEGYWSVGPMDGTGPNVSLYADGTASVSYYDPTKDPWSCGAVTSVEPDAPSEDAAEPAPAQDPASPSMIAPEPCNSQDLGPAPQGDAAVATARDLLAAVGMDPAGFELVAENWGDEAWTYVTAQQVIDGQKSGATWSMTYTGAGLQNLYGFLAPQVSLGEYEVVSPAEAVERLTDPRFGSGWGGPIAYLEGSEPSSGDGSVSSGAQPSVPRTLEPGSPLAWPVTEVRIVDSRLGTAMQYQGDGSVLLLPSYELVSDDGAIWTVVALAESELDFSPVG